MDGKNIPRTRIQTYRSAFLQPISFGDISFISSSFSFFGMLVFQLLCLRFPLCLFSRHSSFFLASLGFLGDCSSSFPAFWPLSCSSFPLFRAFALLGLGFFFGIPRILIFIPFGLLFLISLPFLRGLGLSFVSSLFRFLLSFLPPLGGLWEVVRALGLGSSGAALWPPWAAVVGCGLGHNVGGRGHLATCVLNRHAGTTLS